MANYTNVIFEHKRKSQTKSISFWLKSNLNKFSAAALHRSEPFSFINMSAALYEPSASGYLKVSSANFINKELLLIFYFQQQRDFISS